MRNRIRRALHSTRPRQARTPHLYKPLHRTTPLGRTVTHGASTPRVSRYAPTAERPHLTQAETA
ncbi:hypothetical protein Shyd_26160 [Streptomyces hydrogenans]|uniref:Uncharacterized protein n=1 Tax=Streptomyces hydrogenans TaxID=1873719 RepID=A0ABQ3P898_9ACTN|nr:hypothetical protein GCM10018784_34490 [Streptomyces hydrogenans]GHI21245.1 hypothetical protein Shyd_26160 [Streptomyces hydrogenans]